MFLTILLYALFASMFGLSKETLNYCEPFFLIGSRFTVAGLLLLGQQWIYNRKGFRFNASHLLHLLILGFINIYLTNISEIWSIQYLASSKVCLMYSLSPFLSAFIAFLVLKERLTPKKWIGLLIGFMGLIPIFMIQSGVVHFTELFFISKADLAILAAVVCSVCGWITLKKVIQQYGDTPLLANGFSMFLGGLMALAHSYSSGESWAPLPVSNAKLFIQNTILMCLISNIICYNLYGYLLKRYSATFISLAGLVTPLFASFFGWYFLQETITWHYFASMSIFAVGLSLFYQEELATKKHKTQAQ